MFMVHKGLQETSPICYEIQQKTKFSAKSIRLRRLWPLHNREDLPSVKIICFMLLLIFCDNGSLAVLCGYLCHEVANYNKGWWAPDIEDKNWRALDIDYKCQKCLELRYSIRLFTTSAKSFMIPMSKMGLWSYIIKLILLDDLWVYVWMYIIVYGHESFMIYEMQKGGISKEKTKVDRNGKWTEADKGVA